MGEITKQIDAPPVVEEIQNIEIEVLPCEAENINARLAPEMISGQRAPAANKETDSDFRPPTETNQTESRKLVIRKIWSWAVLALGFVSTAVWICLLGYGLIRLIIEMAI